jgi:hypothetical protein
LFHAEFFRASQLNPPDKTVAILPVSDASETKDQGYKLAVRPSAQEQPVNGTYDFYLQRLFTDVTHPTGMNGVSSSMPLQNPSNPFTVPDHTSPGGFVPRHTDTRMSAATPETKVATSVRYSELEAGARTTPPASTQRPPDNITADGPASIQGFVKAAKGEPIKGADVRIESRDGKQVFSTIKTDAKGRYISHGLQPGVYRVTLLVNGRVKASITNTQTKANQPTQLNFDFKPTSQAASITKSGKHVVWVPARTGSHIGGTWVEVDGEGNPHFDSNIETYNVGH